MATNLDPNLAVIISYRTLIACIGALCVYFGYRLFYVVTEKQGELNVKAGEKSSLKMADIAPGIYFAVLGTVVVCTNLAKPPVFSPTGGIEAYQASGESQSTKDAVKAINLAVAELKTARQAADERTAAAQQTLVELDSLHKSAAVRAILAHLGTDDSGADPLTDAESLRLRMALEDLRRSTRHSAWKQPTINGKSPTKIRRPPPNVTRLTQ